MPVQQKRKRKKEGKKGGKDRGREGGREGGSGGGGAGGGGGGGWVGRPGGRVGRKEEDKCKGKLSISDISVGDCRLRCFRSEARLTIRMLRPCVQARPKAAHVRVARKPTESF